MSNDKKKLLIIEDEKILAEMYRDIFSQAGYQTFLAFDAEQGLELTKSKKPDLILLDILLPKESGIFFLKKIREDPEISSIPVVAFSNYEHPSTIKEAYELGIKAYLLKTNLNPKEIVEKIKEYF